MPKIRHHRGWPIEKIRHEDLLDMPDVAGVNTDHDVRYATRAELASIVAPSGASLIGVADAGGFFVATNVEAVLQEIVGVILPGEYLRLDGTNIPTANYNWTTNLTTTGTLQGGTLTDGAIIITGGNLTGATNITAAGIIQGGTLTDGVFSITGGVGTGLVSLTDGVASWAGNSLTGFVNITATGTVQGGTLTDGAISFTGGVGTGLVSLTDGVASWAGNSLAGFVNITATGTIQGGTLTDGILVATGGSITGGVDANFASFTIGGDTLDTNEWAVLNGVTYNQVIDWTNPWSDELLADPGFDVPAAWVLGAGWTVVGGELVHGAVPGDDVTEAAPTVITIGTVYRCIATVTVDTGSGVGISVGGATIKVIGVPAAGVFDVTFRAVNVNGLLITNFGGGGPVTMTDISLRSIPDILCGNFEALGGFAVGVINVTGLTGTPDALDWRLEGGAGAAGAAGGDGADMTIQPGHSGQGTVGPGIPGTLYLRGSDVGTGLPAPGAQGGGHIYAITGRGLSVTGGHIYLQPNTDWSGAANRYGQIYLGAGPGEGPGGGSCGIHINQDYRRLYFGGGDDAYIWWWDADGHLQFDGDTSFTNTLKKPTNSRIQFRDAAIYIASLDDGHLDLTADTSIDLNSDVVVSGELQGARAIFDAGRNSVDVLDEYLRFNNGALMDANRGYSMPRAGSIVGITGNLDVLNVIGGGGSVTFQARINDVSVFTVTVTCDANGRKNAEATQVRGTDTFVAGDLLTMYHDKTAGAGFDSALPCCVVEVQFDT